MADATPTAPEVTSGQPNATVPVKRKGKPNATVPVKRKGKPKEDPRGDKITRMGVTFYVKG